MNKKELYESIMKNVAKEVKKSLNESLQDNEAVMELCEEVVNKIAASLNDTDGFEDERDWNGVDNGNGRLFTSARELMVSVASFNSELLGNLPESLLKDLAGYLVEGLIYSITPSGNGVSKSALFRRGSGEKCDFRISKNGVSVDFEIKSVFKNNRPKLTVDEKENKDNLCFIIVSYELKPGSNAIVINGIDYVFGDQIEAFGGKGKQPYYFKNPDIRRNRFANL